MAIIKSISRPEGEATTVRSFFRARINARKKAQGLLVVTKPPIPIVSPLPIMSMTSFMLQTRDVRLAKVISPLFYNIFKLWLIIIISVEKPEYYGKCL
jgi:hypothetical protein